MKFSPDKLHQKLSEAVSPVLEKIRADFTHHTVQSLALYTQLKVQRIQLAIGRDDENLARQAQKHEGLQVTRLGAEPISLDKYYLVERHWWPEERYDLGYEVFRCVSPLIPKFDSSKNLTGVFDNAMDAINEAFVSVFQTMRECSLGGPPFADNLILSYQPYYDNHNQHFLATSRKLNSPENHKRVESVCREIYTFGEIQKASWAAEKAKREANTEPAYQSIRSLHNRPMTSEELDNAFADSDIKTHADYVRSILRPAVEIERSADKPTTGTSKFGGLPDLPPNTLWPTHPEVPYRFIAQINFGEIRTTAAAGMPEAGLLSLFVADDIDQTVFWQNPGYVRAIYTADSALTEPVQAPVPVRGEETTVRFTPCFDVPKDKSHRDDWPVEEPTEILDELNYRFEAGTSGDHLLGYPSVSSLAYDPTPGPEWVLLLTLGSDDALEWNWHDGDYLFVFVKRDELRHARFDNLRSDAG